MKPARQPSSSPANYLSGHLDDLLKAADPDTPGLMYFAFADLLLERRFNTYLWKRAHRFFDDIAELTFAAAHDVLAEAFELLWDLDVRDEVEEHRGSARRALFQRSNL